MANIFELAKYGNKWAVYDKVTRTFSCIGSGKKNCEERVKQLNNLISVNR